MVEVKIAQGDLAKTIGKMNLPFVSQAHLYCTVTAYRGRYNDAA